MMRPYSLIAIFILIIRTALGQPSQVGIIDFYGNGSKESELRKCLPFAENDSLTFLSATSYPVVKKQIIDCLLSRQNIQQAELSFVCCDNENKWIVFVGVDTKRARATEKHSRSDVKLPLEMKSTYDSLMDQIRIAIEKGEASENDSDGHSLMNYLPARRLEEKFIIYANENLNVLKEVLKKSNDPKQREAAATIIAYHHDKAAVINDLLGAVSDPNEAVRNNAVRAIGIVADYSQRKPELKINIPGDPFIDMINSISWTDRNKSSFVLLSLTNNRDKQLLNQLKQKALQPITDIANWKSEVHSMPGYILLGRMAQWSDKEIAEGMNDKKESIKNMLSKIDN